MGKPSQITIKKKELEEIPASFRRLILSRPLPADFPLFEMRPVFVQMVGRVLDHIEKNGKKSQGGYISALVMTYFLEYGNNLGNGQRIQPKRTRLVAAGEEDFAIWVDGKAYAIDFDQLQSVLGWTISHVEFVPTIKKWLKS